MKEKILLHICCAPCATYCIDFLKKNFDITGLFYNPNIYPIEEYDKRMQSVQKLSELTETDIFVGDYDCENWYEYIKGLEYEKEGGKRCYKCIEQRLIKAAEFACLIKIKNFASTLSISPHKNVQMINEIGNRIALKYNLEFIPEDFKKKDGFKKSIELSKKYELYRQKYCGCEYSFMESKERELKIKIDKNL